MRKMFTRLFSLALLLCLFGVISEVHAQDCPETLSASNVTLVDDVATVCDSSTITFKVIGFEDYGDVKYAFNYDGITGGGYTTNPTVSITEGLEFDVFVSVGDTCFYELQNFNANVVDSITMLEPEAEHPRCGGEKGEVTINFKGGYTPYYIADAGEFPYLYALVPEADWDGVGAAYDAYTTVSPNKAVGPGKYFVSVYENKDSADVCLIDWTSVAAWDTAVVNATSPAVILDSIVGDNPVCFDGTTTVTVGVSGGTPSTAGLIVHLYNVNDEVTPVAKDTINTTTVDFDEIPEGSYYATVMDSLECEMKSDSTLVLEHAAEVKFDIAIKSVDCFGGDNGEITVVVDTSVTSSANVYEYLLVSLDTDVDPRVFTWTDLDANDSITIEDLYPIYYALSVRDKTNGCDSVDYVNPNSSGNFISLQSPGVISYDVVFENDMDSVVCFGDSIKVWLDNVSGGSDYYEYRLVNQDGAITTWANGISEWLLPAIDEDAGDFYQVRVRDSVLGAGAGCEEPTIFHIAGNDRVSVSAETTDPICAGQNDGTITIFADGGTGTYQYSIDSVNWKDYNVFSVPADGYYAYARDAACPTNVDDDWVVVDEDQNEISVVYNGSYRGRVCTGELGDDDRECEQVRFETDTLVCNGSATGEILVSIDSWSRGVQEIPGPTYGDNFEYFRNIRMYYTTDVAEVYESGTELTRFRWAGPQPTSWERGWAAQELEAGTYYIWATDTLGCVIDADIDGTADYLTVNIVEFDPLELDVVVVDSASCDGANDGTIKLTMTGGSEPDWYHMALPLVGEKSAVVETGDDGPGSDCYYGDMKYGIAATYQQALLKDPSSMTCWPVEGVEGMMEPNQEALKSASVDPGYAEEVYINVTGGTYFVVLYDTECEDRVIVEVDVFGYDEVVIGDTLSVTHQVCGGDSIGSITIEAATGGSGELLYTLYNGTTAADTVAGYVDVTDTVFTGLKAGTYYIEVADMGAGDCGTDMTAEIEVVEPDVVEIDSDWEAYDISCFGASDGKIVIDADGGVGPYQFKIGTTNWRDFPEDSDDKTIVITEPGSYDVWIRDSLGCTSEPINATIDEPALLTVEANGTNDSTACGDLDDGMIEVVIEGGKTVSLTYTIEVAGVDTVSNIAQDSVHTFYGVAAGEYDVYVTEVGVKSPCTQMAEVTITAPDTIAAIATVVQDVSCKDGENGIIGLDITGGSEIYAVTVNGDAVVLNADMQITDLSAGMYEIIVSDSATFTGECSLTLDTVTIAEPAEYLTMGATKIQDITCAEPGMFSVQAEGGTGGYMYYAAVSQPDSGHVLIPDPTTEGWQEDSVISVTDAGTWIVWVMDDNGCIVGGEYNDAGEEVNEWRVPIAPSAIQIYVDAEEVKDSMLVCNGDMTAAIIITADDVTIENDGTVESRGYTVEINGVAGDTLTNLGAGSYIVIVTDTLSGCTGRDTVVIEDPIELDVVLDLGEGEFTCPEVIEGYVEATAMGGWLPSDTVGGGDIPADYMYQLWQNDTMKTDYQANNSFVVEVGNTYQVVVKYNGCTDSSNVIVIDPVAAVEIVEIKDITCSGDTAASVKVTTTGEEGRMFQVWWKEFEGDIVSVTDTSEWFEGSVDLDQKFVFDNENTEDVHYEIWVIDDKGCKSGLDTVTFDQLITIPLELTVAEGVVSGCGTEVTITAAGGVAPYVVMVDDVEVTVDMVVLGGGMHTIKVMDMHECDVMEEITLDYPMARVDSVMTYTDEAVAYSDAEAGLVDTMLYVGEYTFYYAVDTTCENELLVVVTEKDRTQPEVTAVSPTDTLEDNHPTFVITFDGPVTFNDSVMGYLTVTPKDSTEAALMIEITEAMVNESEGTITVDYVVAEGELGLDKNTTYVVAVDSGIVMGDGLAWDGSTTEPWMFTTGEDWATGIIPGVVQEDFKVYPNPFNDYIKVDNYDKLSRVVITNIAGQRVLDIEYPSYEIRTGNLVTGVYVVTLIKDNSIVKSERIIKR